MQCVPAPVNTWEHFCCYYRFSLMLITVHWHLGFHEIERGRNGGESGWIFHIFCPSGEPGYGGGVKGSLWMQPWHEGQMEWMITHFGDGTLTSLLQRRWWCSVWNNMTGWAEIMSCGDIMRNRYYRTIFPALKIALDYKHAHCLKTVSFQFLAAKKGPSTLEKFEYFVQLRVYTEDTAHVAAWEAQRNGNPPYEYHGAISVNALTGKDILIPWKGFSKNITFISCPVKWFKIANTWRALVLCKQQACTLKPVIVCVWARENGICKVLQCGENGLRPYSIH